MQLTIFDLIVNKKFYVAKYWHGIAEVYLMFKKKPDLPYSITEWLQSVNSYKTYLHSSNYYHTNITKF